MEQSIYNIIEKGDIPGLSCAIIKDSLVIYEKGFGLRKKDTTLQVDEFTSFNAASFSKTVFAWLVMQLSCDNQIDLDTPLQHYLEKPLGEYKDYADLADDRRLGKITARMVLSHTTGLPNWRFLTNNGKLKFLFDPGSRFSYSGEGIQLLQMVIEIITGKDLQELAEVMIFEPYGMQHTSYVWQDRFEQNFTVPHDQYERPKKFKRRYEAEAAGSMRTTAGDYARFMQSLLQLNDTCSETVNTMLSPQIRIHSRRMFGPDAWNDTDEFNEKNLSWALGWGYFESSYGRAVFHTGHDFGAQNYAVLFLDKGIGVVLMGNSDNLESVARELADVTIGDTESPFDWLGYPEFDPNRDRTPPPEPVPIQLEPGLLIKFVGEYRFLEERILVIQIRNDVLVMSDDDKDWTQMYPESEYRFFIKDDDLKFDFIVDQEGKVTGFNLLIQGIEIPGEKIK
jgi:CubicO group peptidase (beta-lactamase class C family)